MLLITVTMSAGNKPQPLNSPHNAMATERTLPMNVRVSLDIHPQAFLALEGVDDDTRTFVEPAIEAFSAAVVGLGAVYEARETASKNPALTPEAVTVKTAEFAERKMADVYKKVDAASKRLSEQIAFTESALQEPLTQSATTPMAAELRALVRGMSDGDRRKLLSDSVANSDMQVLTAVLGAHPMLSGITQVEREMFTRAYREKANPTFAKRLKVMQGAMRILDEHSGSLPLHAEKAVGANHSKVKALLAAEAKTKAAFNV